MKIECLVDAQPSVPCIQTYSILNIFVSGHLVLSLKLVTPFESRTALRT